MTDKVDAPAEEIAEYEACNTTRQKGMNAPAQELEVAEMIDFMRQFNPGKGDYTKDRAAWLDGITMDEIMHELAEKRKEQI